MNQMPEQPDSKIATGAFISQEPVRTFDLSALIQFDVEKPHVQILSEIGDARMLLISFRAGQEIGEHLSPSKVLVQILRGAFVLTAGGKAIDLHNDVLLQIEPGMWHSVRAKTDAVMLVTMAPSPVKIHREDPASITAN